MPRVLGSASKIIFCEGRPGSLDDLLLVHLVPVGRVLIKPVGGKHGLRAFIEGYLGSYPDELQPDYLGFRDRGCCGNGGIVVVACDRCGGES